MTYFEEFDVFVSTDAKGNPCAVLEVADIDNLDQLHRAAKELNQPATTFIKVLKEGDVRVRWFAPESEIDLCGHGSLAAVTYLQRRFSWKTVSLHYEGGVVLGRVDGDMVEIEGLKIDSTPMDIPEEVQRAFHGKVIKYLHNWNKDIVLLDKEEDVVHMRPDWKQLESRETFGYVITAKSDQFDFVSRVLLPHLKKREDQATGSAQMILAPFWAPILGRNEFHVFQKSERGGEMWLELNDELVKIRTRCRFIGSGQIDLSNARTIHTPNP